MSISHVTPSGLLSLYSLALQIHPIRTKIITSAVLQGLGDLVAQLVFEPKKKWDKIRTARYAAFGVIVAPIVHYWYIFLSKRHPNLLWRLALDQLVFSPLLMAFFFAAMATLEGRPEAVPDRLLAMWAPACKRRLTLFPFVQFVNFKYVPLEYRAPYGSLWNFVWAIYMSVLANRRKTSK